MIFLPGIADPLPTGETWPPTIELRRGNDAVRAHRVALRALLAAPAPAPYRAGRGIVTVGGGKYWPGIVVMVRLLREMGCALPVQVWHRGDLEPVCAADVAGLGVQVIDATEVSATFGDNRVVFHNEYRGGWETKLYALTHTLFREVLFLDADAYCVTDPAPLFDALSGAPLAFWQDLPHCEFSVQWPFIWPLGSGGAPTVQGGQLVIDTARAWRTLAVAHWMCQHSDYYFGHLYGDQDTWRVALAASGEPYQCFGPAEWVGPAFVCCIHGAPHIVHRCQSKLFRATGPQRCGLLPAESRVFDLFAEIAA